MKLASQEGQPFKQFLWVLNHYFEVHQVALEAKMLGYLHKLAGVEEVALLRLLTPIRMKLYVCRHTPVHHDFALFANGVLIVPLLEDQGAQHLDAVLVRDVGVAGWGDGHCVVAKVDKQVDILPISEPVVDVMALQFFVFVEIVGALCVAFFVNALGDVVANDDFTLARLTTGLIRNARLVEREVLWVEHSKLVEAFYEGELVRVWERRGQG